MQAVHFVIVVVLDFHFNNQNKRTLGCRWHRAQRGCLQQTSSMTLDSYLTHPSLNFLICKLGIIIPTSHKISAQ